MRRVSSRQRLVSWDSFDATHYDSASEEEVYLSPFALGADQDANDCSSPIGNSRKRERVQKHLISSTLEPTLAVTNLALSMVLDTNPISHPIPAFSWELPTRQELYLEDLPTDIHVNILAFLDMPSIRAVMGLNHKYRHLLFSTDAHALWMARCKQMWKLLPLSNHVQFVDRFNLPTAAGTFAHHDVNLPLLMSMTPETLPTQVDETLLESCSRGRRRAISRFRRSRHEMISDSNPPCELSAYDDEATGARFIRYAGLVGSGDRCIRSNHPLPRPQRKDSSKGKIGFQEDHPSLFELLCRGSKAIRGTCLNNWKPFVAPYVDSDHSIQVTPRMIAYFEVTISSKNNDEKDGDVPNFPENRRDCVAVGIATESFYCQTRMPGWDNQSFGYHGDDGGIFHASGGMVERFGPCFGSGDIVGCGIDYVARGIFFTLNGNFLGYGWKQIDVEFLDNDLYPVVGIDTNDPISVNYGNRPFEFDLTQFTMKHESLITPSYKLSEQEQPADHLPSYPEI